MRVDGRWKRRRGGGREVLKVSVLNDKDKEHEYQERLRKVWNEVKERGEDGVEEEWRCFKEEVLKCAEEVCGRRRVGGSRRKGSEWWNEEVSLAVAEKSVHMRYGCKEVIGRRMRGTERKGG